MTPEGKVKAIGRDICQQLGIYCIPIQQGGTGRTGIPDDILCVKGVLVSVEYKAELNWKRKSTLPTLKQAAEMERIKKAGGVPLVVDNNRLFEFRERLNGAIKETTLHGISFKLMYSNLFWTWTLEEYMQFFDGVRDVSIDKLTKLYTGRPGRILYDNIQDNSPWVHLLRK